MQRSSGRDGGITPRLASVWAGRARCRNGPVVAARHVRKPYVEHRHDRANLAVREQPRMRHARTQIVVFRVDVLASQQLNEPAVGRNATKPIAATKIAMVPAAQVEKSLGARRVVRGRKVLVPGIPRRKFTKRRVVRNERAVIAALLVHAFVVLEVPRVRNRIVVRRDSLVCRHEREVIGIGEARDRRPLALGIIARGRILGLEAQFAARVRTRMARDALCVQHWPDRTEKRDLFRRQNREIRRWLAVGRCGREVERHERDLARRCQAFEGRDIVQNAMARHTLRDVLIGLDRRVHRWTRRHRQQSIPLKQHVPIGIDALEQQQLARRDLDFNASVGPDFYVAEYVSAIRLRHDQSLVARRVVSTKKRRMIVVAIIHRVPIRPPIVEARIAVILLHEHPQRNHFAERHERARFVGALRNGKRKPNGHVRDVQLRRAFRLVGLLQLNDFGSSLANPNGMVVHHPRRWIEHPLHLTIAVHERDAHVLRRVRQHRRDLFGVRAPFCIHEVHLFALKHIRFLRIVRDEGASVG